MSTYKSALVNNGTHFLENHGYNIQIFKYKNKYVYMDSENGTCLKDTLPTDVDGDTCWRIVHLRSDPIEKTVGRMVKKQVQTGGDGSTLMIYYDDQNIFD
tara:strand:- start:119 stop:418 length:300 start_codon:yes stop_codon:yes gene_type:complete